VQGVGQLAQGIGIPAQLAVVFAAVVVISFAATTMDTGVRLQRYIISELGVEYKIKIAQNKWFATLLAVSSCGVLALGVDRGAGGMRLWPLFGTTNQLTGAISLLVITLFLLKLKRSVWPTLVPLLFLLVMTTWAMTLNMIEYATDQTWILLGVGGAIFVLVLWLVFEALAAIRVALAGASADGGGG